MDNRQDLQRDPLTPLPNDSQTSPTTPSAVNTPPGDDSSLTFSQWFAQNGITLGIVLGLLILLVIKFNGDQLWSIAKAFLGLSLVIFVHELGHFLVAKWCDVHVTTFSIGFGPAIPGCSLQWGETTYKFALFPLGGYVQMVGQVDGDESSDGNEDDPRSYRNKGVWQRMAIISAGVIMNVILAVILFIVVYQVSGKDRPAGLISLIDTKGAAFREGLRTGAVIQEIGHIKDPTFEDLMVTVMSTVEGEQLRLVSQRPQDAKPLVLDIEPRVDGTAKRPMIGISPASQLVLQTRAYATSDQIRPVIPGSAADQANIPFAMGDAIVACTDPSNPDRVVDLPDDPRHPGQGKKDYFEFQRRLQLLAGKEMTVRVRRTLEKGQEKLVDIKVPPAFHRSLGVVMQIGQITAIRKDSPAALAGIQPYDPVRKLEGDLIERVEIKEADGQVKVFEGKNLDPVRLPFELRQWAQRSKPGEKKVLIKVKRHEAKSFAQYDRKNLELNWDDDWRFDQTLPLGAPSPLAIPELGLAYQVKTTVAEVVGEKSPFLKHDVIKKIRLEYVDFEGTKEKGSWTKLEPDQWAFIFWSVLASGPNISSIEMEIERGQEETVVEVVPIEDKTWPAFERGFRFMPDLRRQIASNPIEAIAFGFRDTKNIMTQVFQNVRGMVTGRISVTNLGGPVTIAKVAYRVAGVDFWEFLFFLGLISVNLAVINFLPIPVLDGGHMVFLIYEKLRGKPASEGVRIGATYAGLAVILGLMIFVLYLDITRLMVQN